MLEKIENNGPKITIEDIKRIENIFGYTLPSDYTDFMLKYNGGRPIPDAFILDGDPEEISGIHTFYSLNVKEASGGLLEVINDYSGRMPEGIFPIAFTDVGDCVCLNLNSKNCEKVLYWDHEEESNPPTYENISLICNSFSELLDGLFAD